MKFIILILLMISCASSKDHQSVEEKKAEIYYTQGTADLMSQDYTQALSNLYQAAALNPRDARIHNNLGMAYYFKGRKNLAIRHIEQSLTLDPKNNQARNNLASIYAEQGKLDEAQALYKTIQEDVTYPYQYQIFYSLGIIEKKRGNKEGALTYYKLALKENSDYCNAHYAIGLDQIEKKQFNEAATSFINASKGECFKDPAPQYYLGMSFLGLEKWAQAKIKFEEIYERFPQHYYGKMASEELKKLAAEGFTKTDKDDKKKIREYQSATL